MTDRPIIFSATMVRALLDGRKTMTRRRAFSYREGINHEGVDGLLEVPSHWQKCKPGDRLYVRETFYCDHYNYPKASVDAMRDLLDFRATHDCSVYEAGCPCDAKEWRPSIHMPRWASRITLDVTGVKVERLQDISEVDAVREGAYYFRASEDDDRSPRDLFADLWNHLHGPDAWDANPFVVAITFRVHKRNIDKMVVT